MRIMLACHAGISTSLIVEKMKEAAVEQGKEYTIWAVEQDRVEEELGKFDILMLGPQVRHVQKKIQRIVGDDIPVVVINPMAYGRGDGGAVIKQAEAVMGGK